MQNKSCSLLLTVTFLLIIFLSTPHTLFAESNEHNEHGEHKHTTESHTDESTSEVYDIHFKTHPDPDKIIPDKDMTELMFNVTHNGEPASDVKLSYRVYTPPKSFWFGTDFPVVEGTQLLSGTVHLPNGSQVISMILPIRGTYRVKATARGPEGVTSETLQFTLSENPQEIVNLSIFLVVLFLIGGIGGFFLSGNESKQTLNSWFILLIAATTISAIAFPRHAEAHGEGNWDPHTLEKQKGVMTLDQETDLNVNIFPQPVNVGEKLKVEYSVKAPHAEHGLKQHNDPEAHGHDEEPDHNSPESHHDQGEMRDAHTDKHGSAGLILAESHFVHSEGGLEMVKQSTWLENGSGEINVQLFDGAPHYLVTRFYKPTERYTPAGGHDHGHGNGDEAETKKSENGDHHDAKPPWEAEMEFELQPGIYHVKFHESGDPAMKWLLLPDKTDHPGETARHTFEECKSVDPGATLPAKSRCFDLTLNSKETEYEFKVSKAGHYRLFTQHLPREFDMTITQNGTEIEPNRKFVTGKGEYLGRSVKWIELNAIQPPIDDIFKSMVTLLFIVAVGFIVGYKRPWSGT